MMISVMAVISGLVVIVFVERSNRNSNINMCDDHIT